MEVTFFFFFLEHLNGLWPLVSLQDFLLSYPKASMGRGREESTEIGMQIEQVDNIHPLSAEIGFLNRQYIVGGLKTGLARRKKDSLTLFIIPFIISEGRSSSLGDSISHKGGSNQTGREEGGPHTFISLGEGTGI